MACYSPITGYRAVGGKVTFRRALSRSPNSPITISCGQCIGCRLERGRQWSVRIMNEAQMHKANSFITLTYDNDHLPDNGSIDLKHWQDFAKRLRKQIGPFRFYHCGEYGEANDQDEHGGRRPHYHAAIFGQDFSSDRKVYKDTPRGDRLYTSKLLESIWQQGFCPIGALTIESASYVARYITKRHSGDLAPLHYEHVNRQTGEVTQLKREYSTMSRRPGIGSAWIKKYKTDVYPHDFQIVNGNKCRPPRYYDNTLSEDELLVLKSKRAVQGSKHTKDQTPERLAVREKVKYHQISRLKRDKN